MNYLLYQAYGSKDIINEAIYSLLSYYDVIKNETEVKVIIYTDDISAFEHYFAEKYFIYRPLTKELIQEWKGNIDFVHRVKIKILQDFFSSHADANVLYLDSDTVFKTYPDELFKAIGEGRFIMHTMEGLIKDRTNPIFKKLFKYLYFNQIILSGASKIRVPLTTAMWNAGVIGMTASKIDILEKVLDFTDRLYHYFPKHIVEQFAFSYYFQTEGEIIPAEPYIYHYWNFKEFRIILKRFFEKQESNDFESFLEKIQSIDPRELIKPKLKYEKRSGFSKFISKILGKQWKVEKSE